MGPDQRLFAQPGCALLRPQSYVTVLAGGVGGLFRCSPHCVFSMGIEGTEDINMYMYKHM